MTDPPLLEVEGLTIRFPGASDAAVSSATWHLDRAGILGLVGESGSGKSVSALAVLRLLHGATQVTGSVRLGDTELLDLPDGALPSIRGRRIAMVFQDPMTSLNPVLTVGAQVDEVLRLTGRSRTEARAETVALFEAVGLPSPAATATRYPHELSGGQQQRVGIALALAAGAEVLLADEPTTALDVTTQRRILDLLRHLRDTRDLAILFISHDLGLVGELADRVVVMRQGRVVESGPVQQVFTAPAHPYTRALLACRPALTRRGDPLPRLEVLLGEAEPLPRPAALTTVPEGPGLVVRDLAVSFPTDPDLLGRPRRWIHAVDGVDLTIPRGTTLGLVGESGCGKTTTARAILGLVRPTRGTATWAGDDLAPLHDGPAATARALRRRIQIVFQDPMSSLDPRQRIGEALVEPMAVHRLFDDDATRRARAAALLREVELSPELLDRHPHALSGGQRQRVGIARALSLDPELLLLDEAVSALDVSVQAAVLTLLQRLQAERGLTYLFVSHDLSVVSYLADTVAVMHAGRVVEHGPTEQVLTDPTHPRTAALLAALPRDLP